MAPYRLVFAVVSLYFAFPLNSQAESIDGRVVQVMLPVDDVTLSYVETKGGMAVELTTEKASVMGTKFYVGDGKVAVELAVVSGKGIVFQGKTELNHGFKFKQYAVVEVLPGHKRAADLVPGDVYVTLPAVTFKMPAK